MNKYFIFLMLAFYGNLFSQSIFGNIVYEIYPLEVEVKSENPKAKLLFEEMKKRAEKQQYYLEFNNNLSKFYKKDVLGVTSDSNEKERLLQKSTIILYGTNDTYFFKKETREIIIKKDDGNLFFLNEKQDWKITSESKKIGVYTCYKAISEKVLVNRNGNEYLSPVVAWFAPELPYSYGPKDFNGLPGLILELQFYKTVYLATKIVVDTNSKNKIELPKGKMTDYKKYQKSFAGKI